MSQEHWGGRLLHPALELPTRFVHISAKASPDEAGFCSSPTQGTPELVTPIPSSIWPSIPLEFPCFTVMFLFGHQPVSPLLEDHFPLSLTADHSSALVFVFYL